jgi:hypothetical protein
VLWPVVASAQSQTSPDAWNQVRKLSAGADVRIKLTSGDEERGKVIASSDTALAIDKAGTRRDLGIGQVQRVDVRQPNMWIATAVIGAGLAVGIPLMANSSSDYPVAPYGALAIAGGVAGGVFIGAKTGRYKPIYLRPGGAPAPRQVVVAPVIVRKGAGFAATIKF